MIKYNNILTVFCCLGLASLTHSAELHTSVNDLSPVQFVYPNANGSRLGAGVAKVGDFNGDNEFLDFAIGAPGFNGILNGRIQDKGAVFIVDGRSVLSGNPTIDLSHSDTKQTIITGTQDIPIGSSISNAGDINADGFGDLLIGSQTGKQGLLIYGQSSPPKQIIPEQYQEYGVVIKDTGFSTSIAGDFNGDGFQDAVFGSPSAEVIIQNNQELVFGGFTLLYGNTVLPKLIQAFIPSPHHFYNRDTPNTSYARFVSGNTDINTDGFSDIIITAFTEAGEKENKAYVVFGSPDAFSSGKAKYGLILRGIHEFVSSCGDVDADGFPELIAGLPNNETLLLKGKANLQGTINLNDSPSQWGMVIRGADRVYHAGDLNGDGYQDLVAAMPHAKVDNQVMTGQVVFLFGRPQLPEVVNIEELRNGGLTTIDYVLVNGLQAFDTFGASVAALGDIQNDGFGDVLIGAPTQPLPGDSNPQRSGGVYLIQGRDLFYGLQTYRSSFSQRGKKQ